MWRRVAAAHQLRHGGLMDWQWADAAHYSDRDDTKLLEVAVAGSSQMDLVLSSTVLTVHC